ncbi:hypothetical protein [Hyphomicrobium sp.]|uniref:hypothetical protein n=1 Tax=Hyphomicrobium sp. TaxID=82 RepID=UPI001D96FB01|nr:hypothetical protein [Hyphomicrobium sp.]MBY0560008.1 hypothetical protein [Hyphomicrobium sp.]
MKQETKDAIKGVVVLAGVAWFVTGIYKELKKPDPILQGDIHPCFAAGGKGLAAVEEYIREKRGTHAYTVTISNCEENGQHRWTVIANGDKIDWKLVKYMGYYDQTTCKPTIDWIGGA